MSLETRLGRWTVDTDCVLMSMLDPSFLRRWDEELPLTQSPYGLVLLSAVLIP